jgi:hypothetical protein|tara:strand:- start:215 stop:616 length:402 start_codon:yes stop_codon:yes gene_type:complete
MKKTIDLRFKKNGRPLTKEEDKRTARIEIRLTQKDKRKVKRLLKRSKYRSMSDMIREILLYEKFTVVEVDPTGSTMRMLLASRAKAIGINFNQVVKILNSRNIQSFTYKEREQLLNQVDIIQQILLKIHRNLF